MQVSKKSFLIIPKNVLGGIMVWNLSEKPVAFDGDENTLPHMRGITKIYNPVTSFCDSNWDSPPIDTCWMGENQSQLIFENLN